MDCLSLVNVHVHIITSIPDRSIFYLVGFSLLSSGGKSIQLSYLSNNKETLIENDSRKSESHSVKFYLSKSLKVFGLNILKYQKLNLNDFKFLILCKPDDTVV